MPKREDYRLRQMEESDLKKILQWRNSERIRTNMYTDHIISVEEHQHWFEKTKQSQSASYQICEFANLPIGLIYFTDIDTKNRNCYWGFYLGETNVPRISGVIMEFLAIEYAFEILHIRKLCCEVFSFNNAVIKLHNRFGFQQEGCFAKHIFKNGNHEDVVFLAYFQEDWINNKSNLARLAFRK